MLARLARRLSVALLLAVLAAGCAPSDGGAQAAPDGLRIVVTTSILGDVVADLVGDAAAVEVLIEPGVDPHGFAPSAADVAALRDADLVVANGLGLEAALDDPLASAEQDGVVVLRVAEAVDPLPAGDPGDHAGEAQDDHAGAHEDAEDAHGGDAHAEDDHAGVHDHAEDAHGGDAHAEEPHGDDGHGEEAHGDDGHAEEVHAHGPLDPHVWFDPLRMARAVTVIADRLEQVAPGAADWQGRAAELTSELQDLDAELADILAVVPDPCRTIVTNHGALRYFADRYDLDIVGTVIPGTSSQTEPSARDLARLAATIREAGVPAIFAEESLSTRLAETLAAEVGRDVEVVPLYTDALGEPGSGAETYAGLLRTDAHRIAAALDDCDA